jgi:3',5'-cyclic-AMP phosphodiesterase
MKKMTNFSFIQITDHHLLESEDALLEGFCPGFAFRMVMRHIAENTADKADFILSTGDLVNDCTDKAYQSTLKMLGIDSSVPLPGPQKINMEGLNEYPLYFLPGNHDDRSRVSRYLFSNSTPSGLYNLTFMHKGVQFILMDWGPESKAQFLPETREFLTNALQADMPSVLVCHQHVKPIGSRWLDEFIADDIDAFWDTVASVKGRVLAILSGHVHITYEEEHAGIPILGLRSTAYPLARTDEIVGLLAPPQYRYVTIQNGILTSRIYTVVI